MDSATKEKFNLSDTDNISDHPYDGNVSTILEHVFQNKGWALDCGAGCRSFTNERLVQLEIVDYPNVDILSANQALPFAGNSFDAVFSLDVLEHVDDPFSSAIEISRVLKPGGILYIDLPFLQAEHGYPHHFFNATRMGLVRLFKNSLDIESHIVPAAGQPIAMLLQFLTVYLDQLPEDLRSRFARLTVQDIVARPFLDWLSDPLVLDLSDRGKWELASTTQAIFRKHAPDGENPSVIDICAADLPGFPDPLASFRQDPLVETQPSPIAPQATDIDDKSVLGFFKTLVKRLRED